jgi:hypothetical protein
MHIVFNRRHGRYGANLCLPTAGNDRNHDRRGSGQSHAYATAEAPQGRKEKSAKDRGFGN